MFTWETGGGRNKLEKKARWTVDEFISFGLQLFLIIRCEEYQGIRPKLGKINENFIFGSLLELWLNFWVFARVAYRQPEGPELVKKWVGSSLFSEAFFIKASLLSESDDQADSSKPTFWN